MQRIKINLKHILMIKKSMILAVMAIGLISACGDKKAKEVKVDAPIEKVTTEISEEASKADAELKAANKKVEDSLRKVDSIQQVIDHGHAH